MCLYGGVGVFGWGRKKTSSQADVDGRKRFVIRVALNVVVCSVGGFSLPGGCSKHAILASLSNAQVMSLCAIALSML